MKFIKNKTEWRIYENISQARKILSDNKQTENNDKYSYIKKGLGNNTGYLGWFTKMIFNSPELTKGDFDYIINFIKNDKYIIESLPKDLIKYESWESLIDDILNIQSNRNIKKIYNELPNSIKELLNYKELSKREKGSFLSLFNNENRRIYYSQ